MFKRAGEVAAATAPPIRKRRRGSNVIDTGLRLAL
jgi:hypothetical protein